MSRRIDALYCERAGSGQHIRNIIAEIQSRAAAVRNEVAEAIGERVEAMQTRQRELIAQIDQVSQDKIRVLEQQLASIESGACRPAPPENLDVEPDPNIYLLDADAVIVFRTGEDDFKEKIPSFGIINESSTYASQSFAKGPALGVLKTENLSQLWVFTCDRIGERRKEGGDNVVVSFTSPEDEVVEGFGSVEVEDLKDGRYKVKFVPMVGGNFRLHIALGPPETTEAVRGSPFNIAVRGPTAYAKLSADDQHEGKAKISEIGDPGALDVMGKVHHPSGVDFDTTGRFIMIADQSNHRIQVFDSVEHKPLCAYGQKGFGAQQMDMPCDVVVSHDNLVVVSDFLNHRLQILQFLPRTMELRHLHVFGSKGTGEAQFRFPKGLTITENGQLLVCDSGNHRVQVFDMNERFKFVREFGSVGSDNGHFTSPLDVAVNCNAEILVSDTNNRIQVFDKDGVFVRVFGQKGRKDGMFNNPTNLTVNDENALFVCDQGNHRIQVLSAVDGTLLHKWGGSRAKKAADDDAEPPPDEEGADPDANWVGLRSPAGIAVNSAGMVVVADYDLNAIFEF